MGDVPDATVPATASSEVLFDTLPMDAAIHIVSNTTNPLLFINGPRSLVAAARTMVNMIVLYLKPGISMNWRLGALCFGPNAPNDGPELREQKKKLLEIFGEGVTKIDFRFRYPGEYGYRADAALIAWHCPGLTEFECNLIEGDHVALFKDMFHRYASQLVALRVLHYDTFWRELDMKTLFRSCTTLKTLEFKGDADNVQGLLSTIGSSLESLQIGTDDWAGVLDATHTYCRSLRFLELVNVRESNSWSSVVEEKAVELITSYGAQLTAMDLSIFSLPACTKIVAACSNLHCVYKVMEVECDDQGFAKPMNDRFECIRVIGSKLESLELNLDWFDARFDIELVTSAMARCTLLRSLKLVCVDGSELPENMLKAVFSTRQSSLELLHITQFNLEKPIVELIANNTSRLREISLLPIEPIGDGTILEDIMKTNPFLRIVELNESETVGMKSEEDVLRMMREFVSCTVKCPSIQRIDIQVVSPSMANHLEEMRNVCLPLRGIGAEFLISTYNDDFLRTYIRHLNVYSFP